MVATETDDEIKKIGTFSAYYKKYREKYPRKIIPKVWRTLTLRVGAKAWQHAATVRLPAGLYCVRFIVNNRPYHRPGVPIRRICGVRILGRGPDSGRRGKLVAPYSADDFDDEVSHQSYQTCHHDLLHWRATCFVHPCPLGGVRS